MRDTIRRGKVLFLTWSAHYQMLPYDEPAKMGKRPFLVVQADPLNEKNNTTIIAEMLGANGKTRAEVERDGTRVFVPAVPFFAKKDGFVNLSNLYTVREEDCGNVLTGNYEEDVMAKVIKALRKVLALDAIRK
jgi:mRNA-degrading endonuclease toxin of MazEF toxin-antitoxin module